MNKFRYLVFSFYFLFACNDNFQEIKEINNYETFPLGVAENVKLIYTDSAKVKAILTSPLNKDYTNQKFPYSEFPIGIKIKFYEKYTLSFVSNCNFELQCK